jgi:hypothetical protein
MSLATVSEYSTVYVAASGDAAIAKEPALVEQPDVPISGASASSAAFSAATRFVRVNVDVNCRAKFGAPGTTALATASKRMTAGATEYFAVDAGGVVAFIASAT